MTRANKISHICKHILYIHAFLRSDTISRLFGIGKGSILKKFKTNTVFKQSAAVFDSPSFTKEKIAAAGERTFVALFGGKKEESLNSLRLHKYHDKVATSLTQVKPQNLPPTCGAAKYHSERVFLQICQWKD